MSLENIKTQISIAILTAAIYLLIGYLVDKHRDREIKKKYLEMCKAFDEEAKERRFKMEQQFKEYDYYNSKDVEILEFEEVRKV